MGENRKRADVYRVAGQPLVDAIAAITGCTVRWVAVHQDGRYAGSRRLDGALDNGRWVRAWSTREGYDFTVRESRDDQPVGPDATLTVGDLRDQVTSHETITTADEQWFCGEHKPEGARHLDDYRATCSVCGTRTYDSWLVTS